MITDKNGYVKIQQEVTEYSSDLVSQEEIDSFSEHIQTKLTDFNPSIMVYGTYNAGKSTLLNALFGQEEMAKTGDSPETAEVYGYEYNGVTIYDTPGINAPQEHEEVTKEHLDKSEIILFVLSNDGSLEEQFVYEKISEIVKANKPIILVLNNKRGTELNSKEAIDEINKVNVNLSRIGDRNGIDRIENKVAICMVNAKTALKAKIENKNLLLEKSNILQLEKMIEEVLEKSGTSEVINALNGYIQKFIDNVILKIDNKIDTKEVQKTEELITFLEKYKQSSEVKLKNIVSKQTPLLSDELASILLSGSATESILNDHIEKTIQEIVQHIESEARAIESNLEIKCEEFTKEFITINPEYPHIDNLSSNNETKESSPMLDGLKNEAISRLKDNNVMKEGAQKILSTAKEYLPKSVMHGKGPVWIEKVAGKAAGKVAIGITVVMSACNMYSAHKEHEEAIQRERKRTLSAKNSAQSISNGIQAGLFANIDEIISALFNNLIKNYKNASKQLDNNNGSLLTNKDELLSIINRL
ncbi:MAG: dynamin family protein [Campylobacterales bacterium]|nr:dynamin family protein [Campylobacterales bacterium]